MEKCEWREGGRRTWINSPSLRPPLAFSLKRLNGLQKEEKEEGSDDFIGCGIVGRKREVKTTAALKISAITKRRREKC